MVNKIKRLLVGHVLLVAFLLCFAVASFAGQAKSIILYDIGAVISDTIAFDEAIKVAYDFQKATPDTLLIITADHETGGFFVLPYTPTSKE